MPASLRTEPLLRTGDDGALWHSWDGHEWWSGGPDELTRELTVRRLGSVAAARACEQIPFISNGQLLGFVLDPSRVLAGFIVGLETRR